MAKRGKSKKDKAPKYAGRPEVIELEKRRVELKLSQNEVADLATPKMSQSQVQRLEKGDRELTKDWAIRLEPALKRPAEQLLFPERLLLVPPTGFDERLRRLQHQIGFSTFVDLIRHLDKIVREAEDEAQTH